MEWQEVDPLPAECRDCQEEDCYNCDIAGLRWSLSRKDELLLKRKSLLKAITRLKRHLEEIDRELSEL